MWKKGTEGYSFSSFKHTRVKTNGLIKPISYLAIQVWITIRSWCNSEWSPDHDKMGKDVTLVKEELLELKKFEWNGYIRYNIG